MMSMRIDRGDLGVGFRVRLTGIRTQILVKDVAELMQAVKHYFAIGDVDKGMHGTSPDPKACPVCRAICYRKK